MTVAVPSQQMVTRYLEATGNTATVNSADLVARVSNFIQEINYQDGALVKKDALLFTIEPEPYKVKLDQAKAAEFVPAFFVVVQRLEEWRAGKRSRRAVVGKIEGLTGVKGAARSPN